MYKDMITFIQRWLFITSKTNIEQAIAFEFISSISQWLNQNPEYNTEKFIRSLLVLEENLLMEFDCFDIDKKKLIKIYVDLIMETLINLDVSNIDSLGLPIFIKDNKYLYYTKKVIDFFFADFYTEKEIDHFVRNLRKNEFKKYSWKNNMIEGNN